MFSYFVPYLHLSICHVTVESIDFLRPLTPQKVTRIGDDATFECEISKPNARATWLKDGMDILPDKKYDISVVGGVHRLTIRSADSIDVGGLCHQRQRS